MLTEDVIASMRVIDDLTAQVDLLWQLIEDAAQIILDLQEANAAQRQLLTTFDAPVMIGEHNRYQVVPKVSTFIPQDLD